MLEAKPEQCPYCGATLLGVIGRRVHYQILRTRTYYDCPKCFGLITVTDPLFKRGNSFAESDKP